jgi:hypothetical protein
MIVTLKQSNENFRYGGCAVIAIGMCFNISPLSLKVIGDLLKINIQEGLTYWEICKILSIIERNSWITIKYIPNKSRVTYEQLYCLFPNGKFLVMFNEHLSCMIDGEVIDDWFIQLIEEKKLKSLNIIPTGWWKID